MKRCLLAVLLAITVCCIYSGTGYAATLSLPQSITSIYDMAFYNDQSFDAVVFPDGIKWIGSKAFAGTSITEVELPSSISYIADDAFTLSKLATVTAETGSYAYNWAIRHGYEDADRPKEGHYETVTVPAVTHEEEQRVWKYGHWEFEKGTLYKCLTCKFETYDGAEMDKHIWNPDCITIIPVYTDAEGNWIWDDGYVIKQSASYSSRKVTISKTFVEDPNDAPDGDYFVETVTVVDTPEYTTKVWVVDSEASTKKVLVKSF